MSQIALAISQLGVFALKSAPKADRSGCLPSCALATSIFQDAIETFPLTTATVHRDVHVHKNQPFSEILGALPTKSQKLHMSRFISNGTRLTLFERWANVVLSGHLEAYPLSGFHNRLRGSAGVLK